MSGLSETPLPRGTNLTLFLTTIVELSPNINPFVLLDSTIGSMTALHVPRYFTISNYCQLGLLGL